MAKDAKRPSWFKLFLHQKAIVDSVDDITAGKALKAAFQYFDTGETVDMDQTVFIVFSAIKPYIDESFHDFQRSSAAGKKGMESRWGKADTPKDPLTPLKTQMPPQAPYNEAEADADTEAEPNAEANVCKAGKLPTRVRFSPPSIEDVRDYCGEQGYTAVDPQRFVDYYASNGWMVGKNKMKDWKAAVRGWNSRDKEKIAPQTAHRELPKCLKVSTI